MKILFSSTGSNLDAILDAHFGRAGGFVLYDESTGGISWHSNETNQNASQGAGTQAARFAINSGASVLITGHVGPKAFQVLKHSEIKVYNASDIPLKEAYKEFKKGNLVLQDE
jgi:predicted Fe-Mo cluster-binding NifX family protein